MISRRSLALAGLSVSLVSVIAGCSAARAEDDATPSESPLISDETLRPATPHASVPVAVTSAMTVKVAVRSSRS